MIGAQSSSTTINSDDNLTAESVALFPPVPSLLNSPKRLPPRSSRLPHPPPLNIPLYLLTPILLARYRLAPRTPIRHHARPRLLNQFFVGEIFAVFAGAAGADFR